VKLGRHKTADKAAANETAVQRCVVQHLKVRAAPGVFAFHVPNGGWRRPIEGAIFKGLGVVAGVPDIIVIRGGRCFALELKSEAGKITAVQRLTLDLMEKAGAVVGVAYGLDDALRWLESQGLLKGRAT
jgi:predicted type IV restriction endonuclease